MLSCFLLDVPQSTRRARPHPPSPSSPPSLPWRRVLIDGKKTISSTSAPSLRGSDALAARVHQSCLSPCQRPSVDQCSSQRGSRQGRSVQSLALSTIHECLVLTAYRPLLPNRRRPCRAWERCAPQLHRRQATVAAMCAGSSEHAGSSERRPPFSPRFSSRLPSHGAEPPFVDGQSRRRCRGTWRCRLLPMCDPGSKAPDPHPQQRARWEPPRANALQRHTAAAVQPKQRGGGPEWSARTSISHCC